MQWYFVWRLLLTCGQVELWKHDIRWIVNRVLLLRRIWHIWHACTDWNWAINWVTAQLILFELVFLHLADLMNQFCCIHIIVVLMMCFYWSLLLLLLAIQIVRCLTIPTSSVIRLLRPAYIPINWLMWPTNGIGGFTVEIAPWWLRFDNCLAGRGTDWIISLWGADS